ncbi:depupylase/deamidase Dop [Bifidobacterium crudilactis]|uniref:depupylase/deamidase Dop n=2 Tax=Bifidobacterium crudilactis TaxID=327277 RepID=UPI002356235F|nr:depupylase/deamidase Dop [Bifidobacterium crudilactis]MCI1868083.1 proteasome accessory factor PafA2 [Bifidobacterium crudilactis]MDN5971501.1 proteasome accessory factor PafA2 [Bifidobacterium crudilactis]MDN6000851.1 proteasome accessory factor PafA2 [Bifidobacterium crudilactis]MDN6208700.1 proteasome accessory factor PafA2 [Bifidobacterium crudilactis]MDN6466443.1 proteasome accessory factor PafA2 [Bifidobacterium crudilactis]
MSVRRVMGTETEYAVSREDSPIDNPVQLSFDVVQGASTDISSHIRWDYRQEDPINDARGTRLERASARPDMLTDTPSWHITNVIASNGGRIYVDHAHPEYSAPESADPFEAVKYDAAGDLLMHDAAERASRLIGKHILLHRNNVDGKGASWGTHESYRSLRAVPFAVVSQMMTAHFVTRQLYTGSGRVGIGERGESAGYQLSQRADYIHTRIGLQTTFDRPIVNTRDESHDTEAYRRLHVIVGDANRMQVPQLLKLGTTSMLLWLTEHARESGVHLEGLLEELTLADPVKALHQVSHDLTLGVRLSMESGEELTAMQIQTRLFRAVAEAGSTVHGCDEQGQVIWPDEATTRIMAMWKRAIEDLRKLAESDDETRLEMSDQSSRFEWLFKWQIVEGLRRRYHPESGMSDAASWADPRLRAVDLSWARLDGRSIFDRIRTRVDAPIGDAAIHDACRTPPNDTRAWLRAELLERFPQEIVAMSWSSITVRDMTQHATDTGGGVPDIAVLQDSSAGLQRDVRQRHNALWSLDMPDAMSFNRKQIADALDGVQHAKDALELCEARVHAGGQRHIIRSV